jgi:hypothetical protein
MKSGEDLDVFKLAHQLAAQKNLPDRPRPNRQNAVQIL